MPGGEPNLVPGLSFPETTLPGVMRQFSPSDVPPKTIHLVVIQVPSPIVIGLVTNAMSVRCAWLPVVRKVSCDITTFWPMYTRFWLWIQTPSPIHEFLPIESFHGNLTRVLGRNITPGSILAPKARSAATRTRELICQGFVTKSSSTPAHKYTANRGLSHACLSPGALARSMIGADALPVVFDVSLWLIVSPQQKWVIRIQEAPYLTQNHIGAGFPRASQPTICRTWQSSRCAASSKSAYLVGLRLTLAGGSTR